MNEAGIPRRTRPRGQVRCRKTTGHVASVRLAREGRERKGREGKGIEAQSEEKKETEKWGSNRPF